MIYFIQTGKLCLLTGKLILLAFNAITDTTDFYHILLCVLIDYPVCFFVFIFQFNL